jgi:hypothetical protein
MQLPLTFAVLATSLGLASAFDLPNGMWQGTTLANGTLSIKAVGASGNEALLVDPAVEKRTGVSKRDVGCFGYQLDASGVDSAVVGLKNWAGNGQTLSSGDRNTWYGYVSEGMLAYYCIDAPRSSGSVDIDDVNYALQQMDSKCRRYEASYFKWPGSVEIVGKGRAGDNICV